MLNAPAPLIDKANNMVEQREIDFAIVKRAQAGDAQAFGLFVTKYQRRLARVVGRMVHNSGDVEDVVQETFIKAYRALPRFRCEAAFYTWLFAIGVNSARNHLSKKNRLPATVAMGDGDHALCADMEIDIGDPAATLASKQLAERLAGALNLLSDDVRQALILREMEGFTYEEIATIMDCPIGTVRSRIFRAREVISARLGPLLEDSNFSLANG